MNLTFLAAADGTRLTKTYGHDETGKLEVTTYPMVRDFVSSEVQVDNLADMLTQLRVHADAGHCLLKGSLTAPLNNESRAGRTATLAPTEWLLLDLDFDQGFRHIGEVLAHLDPSLAFVSYIFQHSTSAGIKGDAGLRGHVFIRLAKPASPPAIKEWLRHKNLTIPALRNQIKLAANGLSVRWPLDITTCQNDKLIYIAPPVCHGFTDPIATRFSLTTRDEELAHLNFSVSAQINKQDEDKLVTSLREANGFTARKPKYKLAGDLEILTNPDPAVVTGIKEERGFVYLNLNHGDSWGYYFPADKPELLYNFKGEPVVRLVDVAPELYKQLRATATENGDFVPFVFRDWETDTYYNGLYAKLQDTLKVAAVSTKDRLGDFLANYNVEMPTPVPDWTFVFDPTTNKVVDFEAGWCNKFAPTIYMKDATTQSTSVPPTIHRLILSVVGSDIDAFNHFINWLAYIFQYRTKTTTAWIFHGVPGTGKGVLLTHVLKPLIGYSYVNEYSTNSIKDTFNAELETTIIQWLDEFHVEDNAVGNDLMDKLKHWITEPQTMIRGMRRNAVQRPVFNNLIIATNHTDPIPLDEKDRRFNVAPAQEHPIRLSAHDIDTIGHELQRFAAYLRDYDVNKQQVRTILLNGARTQMIEASEVSVDRFFRALRTGDLDFFLGFTREKPPLSPNNAYIEFERAVRRWATTVGKEAFVSRDEAAAAYSYLQNVQIPVSKFARMCAIHRIDIQPGQINNDIARGFRVTWVTKAHDSIAQFTQPNIVNLVHAKS